MAPGRPATSAEFWALSALVLAAHVPLVGLQVWNLAHVERFHFAPLAVVGAFLLARRNMRRVGPPVNPRGAWAIGPLVALGLLTGLGGYLMSPWIAHVSLLVSIPVLGHVRGGPRLGAALVPSSALMATTLPLLGLDELIVRTLQAVALRWSSRLLDLWGVLHVPEGDLVRLVDTTLRVGATCSGIQSLTVVTAGVLFVAFWRRTPVFRTLTLLGVACLWVVAMNATRIAFVAAARDRLGIDLLEGWRHGALSLVGLLAVALLLVSSDVVLDYLALFSVRWWQGVRAAREWARLRRERIFAQAALWDDPIGDLPPERLGLVPLGSGGGPPATVEPSAPAVPPDFRPASRVARFASPVFLSLGVASLVWVWPCWSRVLFERPILLARFQTLDETAPGEDLGPFGRVDFRSQERAGGVWGAQSRTWRLADEGRVVMASVDFPFAGWHGLEACYIGADWRLEESRPSDGHMVEASFTRGPSRHGLLIYGCFDASGQSAPPSAGTTRLGLWDRLAMWRPGRREQAIARFATTYQLQLFEESGAPLTTDDRAALRSLADLFHRRVRQAMLGTGGGH